MLGLLILGVSYISKQPLPLKDKRQTILLLAECMMAIIMLGLSIQIKLDFYWLAIWVPYALIMGLTIMFYKFEEIATEEPEAEE